MQLNEYLHKTASVTVITYQPLYAIMKQVQKQKQKPASIQVYVVWLHTGFPLHPALQKPVILEHPASPTVQPSLLQPVCGCI